jgi:transcriptional regulator with XRE-family HTH domain
MTSSPRTQDKTAPYEARRAELIAQGLQELQREVGLRPPQTQREAIRDKARLLHLQDVSSRLIRAWVEELGLTLDSVTQEVLDWLSHRACRHWRFWIHPPLPQETKEIARELRSQGLSFSFIRYRLKRIRGETIRGEIPSIRTLYAWCRDIKVSKSLLQEKAREQEEITQERARWLRSQGFSLSLVLRYLEELGFSASDRALPTLETLSAWCRDIEVDTQSPYLAPSPSKDTEVDTKSSYLTPSPSPSLDAEVDTQSPYLAPSPSKDTTAQEKARELRSQGLSLSLIQDQLKDQGLKTSRGTTPTLKTLFIWCRDIEVEELKRKDREHGGGRPRLEDMPEHKGLASLIKQERLEGKSFDQIAQVVAEKGHRTAGGKPINKTQLISIWRRLSDE